MKKIIIVLLLSSLLKATGTPCGSTKQLHLDNDHIKDSITCAEHDDEFTCPCTFSSSEAGKKVYILEHREFSYIGFTKYKKTPKNVFVVENGYWGYAEHHYYKYEVKYKEWFSTNADYMNDTINIEGGTTNSEVFTNIRWNFDKSRVLIRDKKLLKELSHFQDKPLKGNILFDTKANVELTSKNIEAYNNLAYYLNKEGVWGAKNMLEKIVEEFPKRTVSYYNLGDIYWDIHEKSKAKELYRTYIKQMMAKGKEKKIPKVVKDRVLEKE